MVLPSLQVNWSVDQVFELQVRRPAERVVERSLEAGPLVGPAAPLLPLVDGLLAGGLDLLGVAGVDRSGERGLLLRPATVGGLVVDGPGHRASHLSSASSIGTNSRRAASLIASSAMPPTARRAATSRPASVQARSQAWKSCTSAASMAATCLAAMRANLSRPSLDRGIRCSMVVSSRRFTRSEAGQPIRGIWSAASASAYGMVAIGVHWPLNETRCTCSAS